MLGGDYLLARASVALARLRHPLVVELISTVIEHLVKGEIMQLKPSLQCGQCEPDQSHYSARQQQSQGQGNARQQTAMAAVDNAQHDEGEDAVFVIVETNDNKQEPRAARFEHRAPRPPRQHAVGPIHPDLWRWRPLW